MKADTQERVDKETAHMCDSIDALIEIPRNRARPSHAELRKMLAEAHAIGMAARRLENHLTIRVNLEAKSA